MKRVISIVIVLTMILIAFAGCGGKASESKYVGNWTLATLMYNSQVFSAKEPQYTFASLDIKPMVHLMPILPETKLQINGKKKTANL